MERRKKENINLIDLGDIKKLESAFDFIFGQMGIKSRFENLEIEVMNRTNLISFSFKKHDEQVAVISVSDPIKQTPYLYNRDDNGIVKSIYLKFADVEEGQEGCMTEKDANQIISFLDHLNEADRLIVQCEAGVSRSAGIAGAIKKFIFDDDSSIFNNPSYRPNMTCYRKVLDAFYNPESYHG